MTVVRLRAWDPVAVADDRRAVLRDCVDRALGAHSGKATVGVEDLAAILAIGRSSAYQLVREGRVPSLRVGKAIRVPVPALVALLLGVEP